ncbi:hypothetical protein GCM10010211_49120 [Streptomyces albospinus]|uniref:Uncharacterized protein n=2 Tax=Streptomyces TaxID=1883 RepID=A0A101PBQ3_9ACTN|nr:MULTISPECIES: hypothetical protein [Streptomyces]KUN08571.1 hypothetical protein AQI95_09450 [Streptomyces yokosukanensis]GGU77376.1 hypothetical protein GCM10010211_49120 [Streptomyces albospinus]
MTAPKTTKRPARKPDPVTAILANVKATHRSVADKRMPIGGGHNPAKARRYFAEEADRWAFIKMTRDKAELSGWDAELLEQLFHALAETGHPETAKFHLEKVAAYAVAAIGQLDREAA